MGLFTRRRAPPFTAGEEAMGGHAAGSLPSLIPAEMNFLNDTTISLSELATEKPVLAFARRLSHALTYTLPSPPVPTSTELDGIIDKKAKANVSRINYDTVFKLRLEADELASDEEIEYQDQDVKFEEDDHKRWSALLDEAGEGRSRARKKHRRRRRSISGESTHRSRSRSKSHVSPSQADSGLEYINNFPLTVSVPPSSSPFPSLSVKFQDNSDDDDEPTEDAARPISGVSTDQARSPAVPVGDGFDALDVMADYLFRYGCEKKKWFKKPSNSDREQRRSLNPSRITTGVCIRAKTGVQRTYPLNMTGLAEFETAITALNPEVSLLMLLLPISMLIMNFMPGSFQDPFAYRQDSHVYLHVCAQSQS